MSAQNMQGVQNFGTCGSGWFEAFTNSTALATITITNTGRVPINVDFSLTPTTAGSGPTDTPLYVPAGSKYSAPAGAFSLASGSYVYIQRVGSTDASGVYMNGY
jgi:hypothetical protein